MKNVIFILMALGLIAQDLSSQEKKIDLEDFTRKGTFSAASLDGMRSMNDGEHYTMLKDGGTRIVKYSYESGEEVDVLFDIDNIKRNPDEVEDISGYRFSPDEKKILVYRDVEPLYRHSFLAKYYVYNREYRELIPLAEEGKQQVPEFSPNSQMIAYVRNNNIHLKKLRFGTTSAVTEDGEENKIINGKPDWVYEEEFGYNRAFEWSPNSEDLAYVRFDESQVKQYSFPLYKEALPGREDYALYPGTYSYKYPKAGEENAKVSVHVFNVKNRTTKEMDIGDLEDAYVPRLRWSQDPGKLGVIKLNRRQDELNLFVTNPSSGVSQALLTVREDQYVAEDVLDNIRFLDNGKHFVYVGREDGYNHIHLYSMSGIKVRQVTSGEWDVTNFYGFDPDEERFYFQAAVNSPLQREIYSIDMEGEDMEQLSPEKGMNTAEFSDQFKYFVNTWSSADEVPQVSVFEPDGDQVRVLENNEALREKVADYQIPGKDFFTFENSEGVQLNGYMIRPPEFDESGKYPVLMTQYSGPGSQKVLDRWKVNWEHYLATKGYIVVSVDPRGTGARGEEFLKSTYMQLGRLESEDLIETAQYMADQSYIDQERIGIWGWSYGGTMTTFCMSRSELFNMGIAVAPVTDWRFYDTIYTERFMRKPQTNPRGYDENSPIHMADELNGRLFLIHGSADDNVHFQNTMEYVDKLVQSGKQFDMFVYPNRDHGIRGRNAIHHLYDMMSNYIIDNL